MNIAANTVASKLFVAFVAVAMLFTVAAPAKAATVEELQAQIAALMAQISSLSGGSSAPTAGCMFTRALTTGSTGADVTCLQNYLIGGGFGISAGATGYFGSQTASAVASWQAANGVTPAAGYFGPVSQAKYNALMADGGSTPGTDDSDDNDSSDLQGEADLDSVELSSADKDEVEEGSEDAEIAELKIEFSNGDAEISRLDVSISSTSVDSWDVLEEVSLWVDGDEVARMNADDEDDYLDEDDGTLRFSGLDIVAREDEELTIVIAATIQNNIDSDDMGTFEVTVDSLRFFDADGVATTENATGDLGADGAVEFTLEEAGFEDEILVKSSSEDPDATTLKVEDDSKSDWLTVFMFDLDTDDSINDIELNTVEVTLVLSAAYNTVVDDAELVIDGTTIDDFDVSSTTATTVTLTFDVDGDVTVDAGDRVDAELKLRFKALAAEGTTVKASVSGAGAVEGEGADDVESTGSAIGKEHTLRSSGLVLELDSVDSSEKTKTISNTSYDYGVFTYKFDVTAFEGDFYLDEDASTIDFDLNVNGVASTTGYTATLKITGAEDASTSDFVLNEGETASFTLTIETNTGHSGEAQVIVNSLAYSVADDGTEEATVAASPADEWESDKLILN